MSSIDTTPLSVFTKDTVPETPNTYKNGVAFAMKVIQARVTELATDQALAIDPSLQTYEQKLDYLTANRCKSNSAYVIGTLASCYPGSFETMFIVSGVQQGGFNDALGNSEHSYFVVKDIEGKYFAGSPANTQNGSAKNFETLLEAENLEGILLQISDRSGGNWPTTEQVQTGLSENPPTVLSSDINGKPRVEFTTIAYSWPEYSSRREGYDFTDMKNPDFIGAYTEG